MPSGGSDSSSTISNQRVWAPQGDVLGAMYEQAPAKAQMVEGALADGSVQNQQQWWNQNLMDSSMNGWQNQMGGGNLGDRDIAGNLMGRMGQNRDISAGSVGSRDVSGTNVTGQNVAGSNVMGRDITDFGTDIDASTVAGRDASASLIGQMTDPTAARMTFDERVGPEGSLANMEGMFRRQAGDARSDMLGSMDARAAASGVGGGSAHGNAVGRGMEGITNALQENMATTGYDAYNRDLDRNLGISRDTDMYNEARGFADQASNNQISLANQANNMQGQLANQGAGLEAQRLNQGNFMQGQLANQAANLQSQLANQGNALESQRLNQANNMQGQLANQGNNLAAQQFNSQQALQAGMANQGANIQAGMANQNYAANQQQLMSQLLGQQNANQQFGLGQAPTMAGIGNLGYQTALAPFNAYSQMLQGMGPPTVLSDSESESSGMNFSA